MRFDSRIEKWHPEISTITLYCEGKLVGTFEFDLISYIGKPSTKEKLVIGSGSTGSHEKILVGDESTYPQASVSFQIKVNEQASQLE